MQAVPEIPAVAAAPAVEPADALEPYPSWKVIDQDDRWRSLEQIDIRHIALLSVVEPEEAGIDGTERLIRVVATGNIRMDLEVLRTLRANPGQIPAPWAQACDREGKSILFDGTVFVDPQGCPHVGSMGRTQGEWTFRFVSLQDALQVGSFSALLDAQPRSGEEYLNALTAETARAEPEPAPDPVEVQHEFDVEVWVANQIQAGMTDKEIIDALMYGGWTNEAASRELARFRPASVSKAPEAVASSAPAAASQAVEATEIAAVVANEPPRPAASVTSVEALFRNALTVDLDAFVRPIQSTLFELQSSYTKLTTAAAGELQLMTASHGEVMSDLRGKRSQQEAQYKSQAGQLDADARASEMAQVNKLNAWATERQSTLQTGAYAASIIKFHFHAEAGKRDLYQKLKYRSIAAGVLALIFIKWWLGFLIAGGGYWFFRQSEETAGQWAVRFENLLHGLNIRELSYLCERSPSLKKEVERELEMEQTRIATDLEKIKNELEAARTFNYRKLGESLAALDAEHATKLASIDSQISGAAAAHEQEMSQLARKHARSLAEFRQAADRSIAAAQETLDALQAKANTFADSFDIRSVEWTSDSLIKCTGGQRTSIRYGRYLHALNLGRTYGVEMPLYTSFFNRASRLISYSSLDEKKLACTIANNMVARALLAMPAHKINLTFVDPVDLGANAAPFTPLSRSIHGGMVLTEHQDIEGAMSQLTRNIENVIQRYLQDKYADIAAYNAASEKMSEPYRLLVVYDFPSGFDAQSARKLMNIARSGPRAGVHTIVLHDTHVPFPYGVDKDALSQSLAGISLAAQGMSGADWSFDPPLPYVDIVPYINTLHEDTDSLRVALGDGMAPESEWWQSDASVKFKVPIGEHGGNETQYLTFNNDDENQALLIGRPGSGKSNLLHTIIVNSLWKYSPNELEIYLIDFKGGVEFNIYADKNIPQIRTIAIESEREFGLSVLDGVERALLAREDQFNRHGVTNIAQFREKYPGEKMPRIILVVDEFQEFFVEEDAIKTAVDAKLDRIVKKGRAFGINVIFASQTLQGNSIDRATRQLIGIRMALMCSDTDANQILDDRNPAARDLKRPGQGIYNAQNGKTAGNRHFQAFFAERAALEQVIDKVVQFAQRQALPTGPRQIIFRGSEKARLDKASHPIMSLARHKLPRSVSLWLGEPVAITEDVAAKLRRQGGNNILVAGHNEELGVRILAGAAASVVAHYEVQSVDMVFMNFLSPDNELADIPSRISKSLPQRCEYVEARQVKGKLEQLKDLVAARMADENAVTGNVYLFIQSLQRGRMFRKDGYSMSEEGKLLASIIRDGPDVGVFCILQVDSIENFSKNLEDSLLREFSHRVVSQMNSDASIKLIGSSRAAKLGSNRAYHFDDNENTLTKFKPYELPSFSWLNQLTGPEGGLSDLN